MITAWSILQLFSLTDVGLFEQSSLELLATLIAFICLFWQNKKLFYIGASVTIASILWPFPYVANHQLLNLLLTIVLLFSFSQVSRFSQVTLIAVYTFTSLYKFNTDFFSVTKSCALMPLPDEYRNIFIPAFVVFIELGLLLLFLFKPRSRITWGIAFLFHSIIAVFGVWDFTATILVLAMFARGYSFKLTKTSQVLLCLHLLIWIIYSLVKIPLVPFYWMMTITTMFFFLALKKEEVEDKIPLRTPAYLALAILIYQGSGPLLGHTQTPSLAMFSNLEVTSSYRNSFMPLFSPSWMDSDIKIIKTHAPYYSKKVSKTFKREWARTKEVFLPIGIFDKIPADWMFDFEFQGKTYSYPSAEAQALVQEHQRNNLEKKLIGLRINRQGYCGN